MLLTTRITVRPSARVVLLLSIALVSCDRRSTPASGDLAPTTSAPWFEDVTQKAGIRFVHRSGHAETFYLPEIMGGGAALFDMDNDGDLDLYFVQSGSLLSAEPPGNRLYANRGDGTFADVTAGSGAEGGGYGMGVASADFDNDTHADLFVTTLTGGRLLKGDGRGHFADVTAKAGVGGSGWSTSAAFLDYDADGWLDLFVVKYLNWQKSAEIECYSLGGTPDYCSPRSYDLPAASTLYRNNGNGTFTDVSEKAGIVRAVGNGLGVVAGDLDSDGRIDVFVANDGTPNHLWINRGDGRFEERALLMGCAVDQDGQSKAGMGVHVADGDGDADLDLLVVNLDTESDSWFRNEKSFFRDDTVSVGLRVTSRPFTRFGTAMLDFDNDGWLDIYQANGRVGRQSQMYSADPYAEPNLLFRGSAGPRFEEVRPRGGTATPLIANSRAAAFGDIDNDGGIDIIVANRDAAPHVLRNVVARRGHWLMFRVVDARGRDAHGAIVTMTVDGTTVTRDVRTGYSYLAANDPRIHVGLGAVRAVQGVTVVWPTGERQAFGDFSADQIVRLVQRCVTIVTRSITAPCTC